MSDTKYCYPDSDVLINKKNIRNKHLLNEAEIQYTARRIMELQRNPVKGRFDFDHLKRIHQHIFQDLYEWAGVPRTVDIGKGNLFCPVRNISSYAGSVFRAFAKDCMAAKANRDAFVHTLAKYYGDLNALHPFREGNGRTQREFARELCLACGYDFDLTVTNHNEMLYASKLSFDLGDNSSLEGIFRKAVTPIRDKGMLEQKLNSKITTLSVDDIPIRNDRTIPESEIPDFMKHGNNDYADNSYDNGDQFD